MEQYTQTLSLPDNELPIQLESTALPRRLIKHWTGAKCQAMLPSDERCLSQHCSKLQPHTHTNNPRSPANKKREEEKRTSIFFLNSSYSSFFPKKTTAVLPYGEAPTQHGTNAVVRQCAALVSGRSIQIICRSARHEILFLRLKKKKHHRNVAWSCVQIFHLQRLFNM